MSSFDPLEPDFMFREHSDSDATIGSLKEGGRVFGSRFKLVRILGRGGMGIVWLAVDEVLKKDVALKFLPSVVTLNCDALEALKEETNQSLKLSHPNILRTHTLLWEREPERAAIAMEVADGGTMTHRRMRRPNRVFETEDVEFQRWMGELCAALAYAHDVKQIVHRDLKPGNLLTSPDGSLKVADFGISRCLTDSHTRLSRSTRAVEGTLCYMSPQQLQGERPSVADDIYSLGATMYELLTGKPPFYTGDILHQVCAQKPVSIRQRRTELGLGEISSCSIQWERTILSCLSKNPADRPKSATELARMLRGGSGHQVQSNQGRNMVRRVWRMLWSPQHPRVSEPRPSDMQTFDVDPPALTGMERPGNTNRASVQSPEEVDTVRMRRPYHFWGKVAAAASVIIVAFFILAVWSEGKFDQVDRKPTEQKEREKRKEHEELRGGKYLMPPVGGYSSSPKSATRVSPYRNELGMEFIPIPGHPGILMCITETRVRDFKAFALATGHSGSGMYVIRSQEDAGRPMVISELDAKAAWDAPGFIQGEDHPVVGVSWEDARRFVEWLSIKDRQTYQLPLDALWSAAAGEERYPWGPDWPSDGQKGGNYMTVGTDRNDQGATGAAQRNARGTVQVGSYPMNKNGFFDMSGNAWEWCHDRYAVELNTAGILKNAPQLRETGRLDRRANRVLRGGSWADSDHTYLRTECRFFAADFERTDRFGFRCVLVLPSVAKDSVARLYDAVEPQVVKEDAVIPNSKPKPPASITPPR